MAKWLSDVNGKAPEVLPWAAAPNTMVAGIITLNSAAEVTVQTAAVAVEAEWGSSAPEVQVISLLNKLLLRQSSEL